MSCRAVSDSDSALPLILLLAGAAINLGTAGYVIWGPPHDKGVSTALAFAGYTYLHFVLNPRAIAVTKGYRVGLPAWVGRIVLRLALGSARKSGLDPNVDWPYNDAATPIWFVLADIMLSFLIYALTGLYAACSLHGSETMVVEPICIAVILTVGLLILCCRELVVLRVRALERPGPLS